jgi:hypothetical protein
MTRRTNNGLKNLLSITALVLSLAALQSPLWRPVIGSPSVTAKSGGTVLFGCDRDIEKATILQGQTATLSLADPHQLVIHAHQPGHTHLLIKFKDGERKLYEVVVLPG